MSGVEVHVGTEQAPRWIQAFHAALGRGLDRVFALTHAAAALSRVWYMAVTGPSWWCFRGGVYTTGSPVPGSMTVARFTLLNSGPCQPCWRAGCGRLGRGRAKRWSWVRSAVDKLGGRREHIAEAVAALQSLIDAALAPTFQ